MAKRYSRREFLDRLCAEIERGKPLVMTGAGNGICAKFIERGGVDILGVYNTGYFRMQGHGSLAGMLPMADANQMVFDVTHRALQVFGGAGYVDNSTIGKLFLFARGESIAGGTTEMQKNLIASQIFGRKFDQRAS